MPLTAKSAAACARRFPPPSTRWFATERGQAKNQAIDQKQAGWVNRLTAGLSRSDLDTAAHVLAELGARLEADPTQLHDQEGIPFPFHASLYDVVREDRAESAEPS
jgi:hypothetical protein